MNIEPFRPLLKSLEASPNKNLQKVATELLSTLEDKKGDHNSVQQIAANEQPAQEGMAEVEPVATKPDEQNIEGKILDVGFKDMKKEESCIAKVSSVKKSKWDLLVESFR
jgi:hypothetical protein